MSRSARIVAKTAARGREGMVVAHNVAAAELGAQILRTGGNAFDAAVAMSFLTAVREVPMNSVGGIGILLAHSAATGETTVIDFYGCTPAGLAEDTFVPYLLEPSAPATAFGWRGVRDDRHDRGYLSIGVPSHVAGLAELHRRFATMEWGDLLRPAAALAEAGFEPDEDDVYRFASCQPMLSQFAGTREAYLSRGLPMPRGSYPGTEQHIVQPDLARTISTLADDGPDAFYRGPIASAIADHVQANGGVLSSDDFARFEATVADGVRGRYKGFDIVTSSGMTGGLTLLEMLNLAERLDLGAHERFGGQCLHLLTEIMRQAWTDRFVYVGDPAGATVPADALIDKAYAASVLPHINPDRAPTGTRPGDPWPFSSVPRPSETHLAGDPGGTDTTHLAAADADGNVVTLTQTIGLPFGSGVVAPPTGVLLADLTMWLNPEPGTPNSVGPWKRQLGHAVPTILFKDGKPVVALGAPGGRQVVSAIFQVIVNMVDFGMDVQEAIGAPRIHCLGASPANPIERIDTQVVLDDRIPGDVVDDLTRRGHHVRPVYESATMSFLAKPLGIQFDNGELIGGVDVFRRSIGIGV